MKKFASLMVSFFDGEMEQERNPYATEYIEFELGDEESKSDAWGDMQNTVHEGLANGYLYAEVEVEVLTLDDDGERSPDDPEYSVKPIWVDGDWQSAGFRLEPLWDEDPYWAEY
jgi:hypothetical protein